MVKLLCIGDIFLDILPSQFPIAKEKILQDGESFVKSITFQRGGCAGNFVAVFKTIFPNATVDFVSRIGADANGQFLLDEMKKYKVNAQFIRDPTALSAITIAVAFQDGERHFITNLGALENFTIDDISDSMFQNVNHVAYRGIWFMAQLLEKAPEFLKKAYNHNIPVSMDLGFDPFWNRAEEDPSLIPLIKKRKAAALNALKYVTYLFGNQKEFMHLTETKTIDDAIIQLLGYGVKYLIIHQGSKGASVAEKVQKGESRKYSIQAIPPAPVKIINPVGSGDTFDSIFVSQTLQNKSPIQAAALAAAGAAYSLQSPAGTQITLEAVKEFISQVEPLKKIWD
jgi:sugar/nucleoside kinase (ribokinase family)